MIPANTISSATSAYQHSIEELPEDALVFLLGSRYCDTEKLSEIAWKLFGQTPMGWARVQAICDFVHNHISFGYEHARVTRTASEAFNERKRRMPRFCASGGFILPLHEYSGPLLHRLSRRYRSPATIWSNGLRRLVRGLSGRKVVYL